MVQTPTPTLRGRRQVQDEVGLDTMNITQRRDTAGHVSGSLSHGSLTGFYR